MYNLCAYEPLNLIRIPLHSVLAVSVALLWLFWHLFLLLLFLLRCYWLLLLSCRWWRWEEEKKKCWDTFLAVQLSYCTCLTETMTMAGKLKSSEKKMSWVPHVITYTTKEIHLSVDNWVVKNFIIGVIIFYRNLSLQFGELVERDNRRSASESTSKTTQTIHFFFIVSRSHQADEATLPYTPEKILHVFLLLWCFSDIFTYTQFELLGAEWTHSRKLEECSSVSILQQDRGERARSFK